MTPVTGPFVMLILFPGIISNSSGFAEGPGTRSAAVVLSSGNHAVHEKSRQGHLRQRSAF